MLADDVHNLNGIAQQLGQAGGYDWDPPQIYPRMPDYNFAKQWRFQNMSNYEDKGSKAIKILKKLIDAGYVEAKISGAEMINILDFLIQEL